MWATSTDGDLWAPHPQLGRGLVNAAREAWAEGVARDVLPVATDGFGNYYALRLREGVWGPELWFLDHEVGWEARLVHPDVLDWAVEEAGRRD